MVRVFDRREKVKPPLIHIGRIGSVAASLIERHGASGAYKHSLREQQEARRARSRKRFAFWTAVAQEVIAHKSVNEHCVAEQKPTPRPRGIEQAMVGEATSPASYEARSGRETGAG